jgi:hypothetical protein
MRLLLLPIVAITLGAPSSPPSALPVATVPVINPLHAPPDCPETPMSLARRQGEGLRPVPLDRLPDALTFAAVDRRVDRCPAPLILGRGPGGR